jgi:hypothetical protein
MADLSLSSLHVLGAWMRANDNGIPRLFAPFPKGRR